MIRNHASNCGTLASRQWTKRLAHNVSTPHLVVSTCQQMPIIHKRAPNNESNCPTRHPRYFTSNSNKSGANLNGSTQDIIDSTAATTKWKRNHYRKITEKFEANTKDASNNNPRREEPLQIDNYEDVQPMWKQMESRVTRRRSLTADQRGGVSGRRNVRRSDEDVWLEAGVYDDDSGRGDEKKE